MIKQARRKEDGELGPAAAQIFAKIDLLVIGNDSKKNKSKKKKKSKITSLKYCFLYHIYIFPMA